PVAAPLQIVCRSRSPRGSSCSLLLAQPCSRVSGLIQIRHGRCGMGMADSPAGGGVVEGDFPIQVYGHLRARGDVDGGEGLAVQLVDPVAQIADSAAEDAVQ